MINKNSGDSRDPGNEEPEKEAGDLLSGNDDSRGDEAGIKELDDLKTQQFSHDQLKESEMGFDRYDEQSTASRQVSREIHFRTPEKSPYRPLLVILLVVLICFLALAVIQMVRTRRNAQVLENAARSSVKAPGESDILKSIRGSESRVRREEQPRQYSFPKKVFMGSAPLRTEKTEALYSQDQDPEVAALIDAFNVRYRMIFGIKVSRKADIVTETCRGVFRGFGISSIQVRESDRIIKDEITLVTPSGGTVRVGDKILKSVSRCTYDELKNELDIAGIVSEKETIPEKEIIRVQLRITDRWEKRPAEPYLIYGNGVEGIKLGMGIEEMKAMLSDRYRILMRRIMVGNRFETILKIDDRDRTPLFFIYERNEKIWGIEVVHARYKTRREIGIGSTLGMVRIFYPDVNIVSIPGKLTYLFVDDSLNNNIKFMLLDENRIDFEKEKFPFDLKINSVLVGNSPYLER